LRRLESACNRLRRQAPLCLKLPLLLRQGAHRCARLRSGSVFLLMFVGEPLWRAWEVVERPLRPFQGLRPCVRELARHQNRPRGLRRQATCAPSLPAGCKSSRRQSCIGSSPSLVCRLCIRHGKEGIHFHCYRGVLHCDHELGAGAQIAVVPQLPPASLLEQEPSLRKLCSVDSVVIRVGRHPCPMCRASVRADARYEALEAQVRMRWGGHIQRTTTREILDSISNSVCLTP
jgi:hypothetical protein